MVPSLSVIHGTSNKIKTAGPLIDKLLFENSMHGPSECLGNIQQLCFKHEYPDSQEWFAFVLCLNKQYHQIGLNNKLARSCGRFFFKKKILQKHYKLCYSLLS
jgi:hypothetical protein